MAVGFAAGMQGATLAAAALLTAGLLAALGQTHALFPRVMRVPLQQLRAGASKAAAIDALRRGLPGTDVRPENSDLTITSASGALDAARARAILMEHGFSGARFTIGPDIDVPAVVARLAGDARAFAVMVISLPLVLLTAALILLRRAPAAAWERRRRPLHIALAGLLGGAALIAGVEVVSRLMTLLGVPIVEQPWLERVLRSQHAAPLAIVATAAIVLAPIGEELFYRGWMLRFLAPRGMALAVIVSTVLFAAVHFHAPAIPAYLVLGGGLAAIYRISGSIAVPIIAHAVNNAVAVAAIWTR
jgi:membrane protease YdiL (CAAX protease family)